MRILKQLTMIASIGLLAVTTFAFVGCDNKDKVLDIETPNGEVEVERDRDTGEVDVEVND